ncbi:hypothetical protein R1flu_021996 [Riccia fluitans]|uniref:Uncharacterized protein n=1 Tax=Riccia fluitans TaxID=41844 RepID=A0ABD1ZR59_9MARC
MKLLCGYHVDEVRSGFHPRLGYSTLPNAVIIALKGEKGAEEGKRALDSKASRFKFCCAKDINRNSNGALAEGKG